MNEDINNEAWGVGDVTITWSNDEEGEVLTEEPLKTKNNTIMLAGAADNWSRKGWHYEHSGNELISECGVWKMYGGHLVGGRNAKFSKFFALPDHKFVTIEMRGYIMESWDNEWLEVYANGVKVLNKNYSLEDFNRNGGLKNEDLN